MTPQSTGSVQQLGTQVVGLTPISNQYRPGFLQMTPQSTRSLQPVTPQIVAPTGMSTDLISNQYRPPNNIPITPQSSVSVLVPQIEAPAPVMSTDSMRNQYRPPSNSATCICGIHRSVQTSIHTSYTTVNWSSSKCNSSNCGPYSNVYRFYFESGKNS